MAAKTIDAEAGHGTTIIREIIRDKPVEATALAERYRPAGQVTLQFRKTYGDGRTQYNRGVCAGFSPAEAERILNARAAVVVTERDLANMYVTK